MRELRMEEKEEEERASSLFCECFRVGGELRGGVGADFLAGR